MLPSPDHAGVHTLSSSLLSRPLPLFFAMQIDSQTLWRDIPFVLASL